MTFKEAVEAAPPPVDGAYRPGKRATENRHRGLVTCADPARLTGSIDLDAALRRRRPQDNRWDYGLGHKPKRGREQAIWVEVHPATTSEVSTVLKKLKWLKDWLKQAAQLKRLTDRSDEDIRYVWIASKGDKINRNSRQYRQLRQRGLDVKKGLPLP
ncbi:MAG: hypothetical protein OXI22_12860 [Defluviicoccus sp.]|nr:hypothetical protein [Defluviicoccus sp.]MDE0384771.1 hypothetical protein [Defluviicoccus sp.]